MTCVLLSDRLPLWKGIAGRDDLFVAFNLKSLSTHSSHFVTYHAMCLL